MAKIVKYFGIIMIFSLLACGRQDDGKLQIKFSADRTKIVFDQISPAGLLQLRENLGRDSAYQKLASVLQTPAEDDSLSMEKEWPGKLILEQDKLVFLPDSPFVEGKYYLVETFINTQFASRKEVLTSDVGHQLKPIQQILRR